LPLTHFCLKGLYLQKWNLFNRELCTKISSCNHGLNRKPKADSSISTNTKEMLQKLNPQPLSKTLSDEDFCFYNMGQIIPVSQNQEVNIVKKKLRIRLAPHQML